MRLHFYYVTVPLKCTGRYRNLPGDFGYPIAHHFQKLDGRPKMRWLDRLKSDMRIYGINPEMATDIKRWAVMVKNVDTTQMVEDGNG